MELKYLNKFDLEVFLDKFYSDNQVKNSVFTNHMVLDTYLNKMNNRIFSLNFEGQDYLVIKRNSRNEYRFFFKQPPTNLLTVMIEELKPIYISSHFIVADNLIEETGGEPVCKKEKEIIVATNLDEQSSDIKRKYRQAIEAGEDLLVEDFDFNKHAVDLLRFLEEWRHNRGPEKDIWARIENDLNLLVAFGESGNLEGLVIKDRSKGNKVIAYNLFCKSTLNDVCISVCSKVLRGYKNLGVRLKIESFKKMKDAGFDLCILGAVNNEFKQSFDSTHSVEFIHTQHFVSEGFQKGILNKEKFLMSYF